MKAKKSKQILSRTLALVLSFLMAFSVFANVSGMFLTASAADIVVWDG